MKFLFISLITFSSMTYASHNYSLSCNGSDYKLINEFSLAGTIEINHANNWSTMGELELGLRLQGSESDYEYEFIKASGSVVGYGAGEFGKEPMISLSGVDKDSEIVRVQFNGNHPQMFSSSIRLSSGRLFRARCELRKI